MTKVQIYFKVEKAPDAAAMSRLADTSSLYGILGLKLSPDRDGLTVEYDATRLQEKDVEAALARAGVAAIKSAG
jgi:hypothetical protein